MGLVVPGIETGEIQPAIGFNIPLLIFALVPVFSMTGQIVESAFTTGKLPGKVLNGEAQFYKLFQVLDIRKLVDRKIIGDHFPHFPHQKRINRPAQCGIVIRFIIYRVRQVILENIFILIQP